MIFSSVFFLFVFLPAVLLFYYLVPGILKNLVLLFASLIFYAWGEPVYVFLMIFSILYNYVAGIEIDYYKSQGNKKKAAAALWMSVGVNLGILMFFKYFGFLIENVNRILPVDIPYRPLPLPVGISFYTFQTLSYIIDVYKEKTTVQKNIVSFGTYISMFPQLVAGPIVQYGDIQEQLEKRSLSAASFGDGAAWFIRGLGKKVLLANNIGMTFDAISALPSGQVSVLTAWLGCAAYTFQIYFDFSGYSDMAVGLGKMLGFDFVQNFDYPYTSKSVTEFWRRWHISLGTWFREYVYIPLGGNRVSKGRAIGNIFVVWILTGLWHGASWNFLFWGLYYGVILLLEKYVLRDFLDKIPGFVKHVYTMLLVMIGWVFFSAPDMGRGVELLGNMFGVGAKGFVDLTACYYLKNYLILLVASILCSGPYPYWKFLHFTIGEKKDRTKVAGVFYGAVFLLSVAYLVNATYNPFLYFRF